MVNEEQISRELKNSDTLLTVYISVTQVSIGVIYIRIFQRENDLNFDMHCAKAKKTMTY